MQATASMVSVRNPDGTVKVLTNADVLMGDLGLFVRSDEGKKLEMYVWENVLYMMWDDLEAVKTVWEEMLAELVLDAFDDEDYYEESAPKHPLRDSPAENPPQTTPTSTPTVTEVRD